jgi:tRNA-2-methylthio-N6-dimethylallyladenosine synthase
MYARIRDEVPGYAVTSDFIVGFCGETEADFEQTVALVEECRFKNSFIFKYSQRPGTKGAELYADDVPDDTKRRRNNELLAIQNRISQEDNGQFLGRTVEVLVEGPSKDARKHADPDSPLVQLVGRTHCDRIVVFEGNRRQIGQLLPLTIYDTNAHTLFGQVVMQHVGPEVYQLATNLRA